MSAKKQGQRWNLSGVKGKKGALENVQVEIKDKKESAYLMDNQFAHITVVNKTSGVAIDGCKNCTVVVDEVRIECFFSLFLSFPNRGDIVL